jgi:hypothetical protein
MWSIICLCGYHTYLISSEVSTNEDVRIYLLFILFLNYDKIINYAFKLKIKESFNNKRNNENDENSNPYDKGNVFSNFANVLCISLSPSVINLRETIPNKLVNDIASSRSNLTNAYYTNNNNINLFKQSNQPINANIQTV